MELGDDPTRTGVYTFRLQLNNLTQEPLAHQLYADAFTQNVFQDEAGNACLDTLTRTLEADVDFAVNGASLSAPSDRNANFDFNGDGRVTRADGQLLLDHVTLGTELTANADYADMNGDGQVNTYDVHQFLRLYPGRCGSSRQWLRHSRCHNDIDQRREGKAGCRKSQWRLCGGLYTSCSSGYR